MNKKKKQRERESVSNPTNNRREQPSTYFVQDRANEEELTRLRIQDQMLTSSMGGVLAEQLDPQRFQYILDIGCGTGGWLIEVARTYPTVSWLVGVDISDKMIGYATEQARIEQVSDRVQFRVMDVLRPLEFPDHSFDLVNVRLSMSYMRTIDWPKFLGELRRVTRTGGVIRITESAAIIESNSPAFRQLGELFLKAMYQSAHFFTLTDRGLLDDLAPLLQQYGCQSVQTRAHTLEYRAGTVEGQNFYEDIKHAYRTLLPFLQKWTRVPDDYEEIYQQALKEMQQPDFVATWALLTAWGVPFA